MYLFIHSAFWPVDHIRIYNGTVTPARSSSVISIWHFHWRISWKRDVREARCGDIWTRLKLTLPKDQLSRDDNGFCGFLKPNDILKNIFKFAVQAQLSVACRDRENSHKVSGLRIEVLFFSTRSGIGYWFIIHNKQTPLPLVRKRTVPTDDCHLTKFSANFCEWRGVAWSARRIPYGR
jgi:hypothetical protein